MHLDIAKHLTAERKTEEFIPGKGVVTKWERIRRNNHWFDAFYNACAAGYICGVRLIGDRQRPQAKEQPKRSQRKWINSEGWRWSRRW